MYRPSAHCEDWMPNCWSGGTSSPPFYGSTLGNNYIPNYMPSLGGGQNPNTHQETNIPVISSFPTPINVVENDLVAKVREFVNENPVIVLGGIGLIAVLLLKK